MPAIECFTKARRPDMVAKFTRLSKGGDELKIARDLILEEFKLIQAKAEALKKKVE